MRRYEQEKEIKESNRGSKEYEIGEKEKTGEREKKIKEEEKVTH